MTQTTAQTEAIKQAAQHVQNAAEAITRVANQVYDAMLATKPGYQSEGADLFRNLMGRWHTDTTDIIKSLDNIGQAMIGAAYAYDHTMTLEGESANQIMAILNGTDV